MGACPKEHRLVGTDVVAGSRQLRQGYFESLGRFTGVANLQLDYEAECKFKTIKLPPVSPLSAEHRG
jgi:hypothetical protein